MTATKLPAENPIRYEDGDPTKVGYARVSTGDQDLTLQLDALKAAGCGRAFWDHGISGSTKARPGLDAALGHLRDGDTLTVWKLDRLGRSTSHLVTLVEQFRDERIGFHSVTDGINTATPAGEMLFTIMAAVAQMERSLTIERTRAGLAAAKARGRQGGRKPSLNPRQVQQVRKMRDEGETLDAIAETFGVSRSTVIRVLNPNAKTVSTSKTKKTVKA
ncbi:recombinase family protein [Dietzia maris]